MRSALLYDVRLMAENGSISHAALVFERLIPDDAPVIPPVTRTYKRL